MTQIDADGTARLIYLSLLGCAILAGVLAAYRGRMGTGMRDAAVWLLIILGFVAVYGLKDDLRSALFPSEATVSEDGVLVLRRGAGGHFELDAEVNGAPIRFIVDTGATGLVLRREDAERAGLDMDDLAFTGVARTANGEVRTARARLRRVEFGGLTLRDVPASVNEGDLFQSLMGMSVLSRFARVSIEGDRLVIVP